MEYQLGCAVWETTLKCNLHCAHCGSSAGVGRKNELTTKESFSLCEELAALGCENVSLMGGEPLLRDDWFAIGECVRNLGMELSIVSNGWNLPQQIERISQLKPMVVGLSLDGMEKTHDSIRRKGSYRSVMKSLELLREKKIQTTLITTASKTNFKELPQMKEIIFKKEANWQIQLAMPMGNFDPDLLLTREEYYAVAMFIANQRIQNKFNDLPVIGAHCFGYHSRILPGCGPWKGCTAGISSVGITSDGGVVGCLSMGNDRFIEGNVRNGGLKKIWNDPTSFSYNRSFNSNQLGPYCRGCSYGDSCKGGCNSMSFNITNNIHNTPYCFYSIERDIIGVKDGVLNKIKNVFKKG